MRIGSTIRTLGALGAVALALLLLPEVAAACPVCFDASDENRQAFLATTAFLSLLPLGMVAGTGLWIRRRTREQDELYGDDARDEDRPEV
jgi:hypothetical protein